MYREIDWLSHLHLLQSIVSCSLLLDQIAHTCQILIQEKEGYHMDLIISNTKKKANSRLYIFQVFSFLQENDLILSKLHQSLSTTTHLIREK